MYVSIMLEEKEKQLLDELENIALVFQNEICDQNNCKNCHYRDRCEGFLNKSPVSEIFQITNFLRNIP